MGHDPRRDMTDAGQLIDAVDSVNASIEELRDAVKEAAMSITVAIDRLTNRAADVSKSIDHHSEVGP